MQFHFFYWILPLRVTPPSPIHPWRASSSNIDYFDETVLILPELILAEVQFVLSIIRFDTSFKKKDVWSEETNIFFIKLQLKDDL